MTEGDYDQFAARLNALGDMYGKPQSEWALTLWWGALSMYDLAAISDALTRHVRNPDSGQFMPRPADVVKMIGGTTIDAALQAWSKVDRAVRCVGPHRDVVFDDPLIHRVLLDMGGWTGLAMKTEREWPFVAKEFENRYRGYARGPLPEYPPVLEGISNAQNGSARQALQPPVLIGLAPAAVEVMRRGTAGVLLGMQLAGPGVMRAYDASKSAQLSVK